MSASDFHHTCADRRALFMENLHFRCRHQGRDRSAGQNVWSSEGAFGRFLCRQQGGQSDVAFHKRLRDHSGLFRLGLSHVLRCAVSGGAYPCENGKDEQNAHCALYDSPVDFAFIESFYPEISDEEMGVAAASLFGFIGLFPGKLFGHCSHQGLCSGSQGAVGLRQAQHRQWTGKY